MIVMFQRTLAPYRVSLFNSLSDALGGQFSLVLSRRDSTPDRAWTVPRSEVRFRVEVLPGNRLDIGNGTWEVSRGVRATLDSLKPEAVVLSGWDVHASWAALWWARRRGVPAIGWVESWQDSGRHRGAVSTAIRRRYLTACSAAIVPGVATEEFVHQFAPDLPCHHALSAVDLPDLRALGAPSPGGAALFIGELVPRKGIDLILAAAAEILQLFPRLIIAGDGPLRPAVTALAARLPGLEYAGFVEGAEKTRLFEQSAVVLIPSRRDCGPMVASEALVALRPIVMGPGAGALLDMRRIAGDAVSAMSKATPRDLVDATSRVRGQVVPPRVRAELGPKAMGYAMAVAARSTCPGTPGVLPGRLARNAPRFLGEWQ